MSVLLIVFMLFFGSVTWLAGMRLHRLLFSERNLQPRLALRGGADKIG